MKTKITLLLFTCLLVGGCASQSGKPMTCDTRTEYFLPFGSGDMTTPGSMCIPKEEWESRFVDGATLSNEAEARRGRGRFLSRLGFWGVLVYLTGAIVTMTGGAALAYGGMNCAGKNRCPPMAYADLGVCCLSCWGIWDGLFVDPPAVKVGIRKAP